MRTAIFTSHLLLSMLACTACIREGSDLEQNSNVGPESHPSGCIISICQEDCLAENYETGRCENGECVCSDPIPPTRPSGAWEQISPTMMPPERSSHAIAYDAERQVVVLFGGFHLRGEEHYNDTWIWDGSNWTQATPEHSPTPRYGHRLVYDAVHRVVMLFGGSEDEDSGLDDTWIWNGSDWMELTPRVSPSHRSEYGMAYDAERRNVVLFGGFDNARDEILGETWIWDGYMWEEVSPAESPPAQANHTMALDSSRGVVVLYGTGANRDMPEGQTWEWDGTTWRNVSPALGPVNHIGAEMVYDAHRGVIVLFGGLPPYRSDLDCTDYTWEWDGELWYRLETTPAPLGRTSHALTYFPSLQSVVLYSGIRCYYSEADTYDMWLYTSAP